MDQIYYHGRFHTLCGPDMEAIAVKDGKIAALGSTKELLPLAGPHTLLVDLEGNSVLPGFIDSHCHLLATGQADEQLDLHGCRSVQEMIERGREFIRSRCLPAGAWVVGGGYDHNLFDPPILPDGAVAQAISSEHPVMFERVCGHVGAANPLALSLAGFGPETEIEGGELDRDEAGCLTGVLREAALDRFKQFIPPPDQAMLTRALTAGIRTANQGGVTSVHSDDLVSVPMEAFLEAVKTLRDQGQFHIRVWEEVEAARLPLLEKLLDQGQRTGDGDCWYRMGNLKLLLDGSLGARTAYLRRPYEDDPGNQGIRVYEQQDLDQLVLLAHRSGLQVAFHAIGDGAVEQAVTAVERAQRICPKDLCHRIVHCQIADRALFRRMAACGLGADIQPAFTSSDWPLVRSRLGEQRESGCYAWRSMLDAGLIMGGGSDCPVEPFEPLWGMLCAVTREDCQGQPQGGWQPAEKLTIGQAVDLYTRSAASLEFAQGQKGVLRAGALADFVVLSEDFLQEGLEEQAAVQRLRAAKVLRTVIGGETVYQRT